MTVSQLIQQLQALPPEIKVVVRGYEDGYNDILKLRVIKIKRNENANWYIGEFEDTKDADAIDAIDLFGDNKNLR